MAIFKKCEYLVFGPAMIVVKMIEPRGFAPFPVDFDLN
jgi:hypothetical protein